MGTKKSLVTGRQLIESGEEFPGSDGFSEYDLATHSVDMATEYLRELMNGKCEGPHGSYEANIGNATEFIHANVWRDSESAKTITSDIIPLLEKAIKSIRGNSALESHVKARISGRILNLTSYSQGIRTSDLQGCFKQVEEQGEYKFMT